MTRLRLVALALALAACGKKSGGGGSAAPELTGLAAVPANAEDVIGVDVAKLLDAPLLERAIDQLFLRNATLASEWQKIHDSCKLSLGKQIKHVMLALGPHPGTAPGTGPTLIVATGQLVETELATCIRAMVGQGGGELTAKTVDSRTLYSVKDGTKAFFFGFGRADTVVSSSQEAYVALALGSGKKAPDEPELTKWIALADQTQPIWWAGRVDERISSGLVKQSKGKLPHGPIGMAGTLDPTAGAKLDVKIVMSSADDAKLLESFAKDQLAQLAMAAQLYKLGGVVNKVELSADGAIVRLRVALTPDDVNQVLSALDGGGGAAQDAPPSQGSN